MDPGKLDVRPLRNSLYELREAGIIYEGRLLASQAKWLLRLRRIRPYFLQIPVTKHHPVRASALRPMKGYLRRQHSHTGTLKRPVWLVHILTPNLRRPRDGRSVSETRPFLRTQDSVPSSPDLKRSNDGLRPTTPGSAAGERPNVVQSPASSLGQRSPLEKVSIPEPSGHLRDIDVPNDPIDAHALKNETPQPTVEPTPSVSPAEQIGRAHV